MSLLQSSDRPKSMKQENLPLGWIVLSLIAFLAGVILLGYTSPHVSWLRVTLDRLFALNSEQSMWYLTRAAGITSYLLLWLSTIWGLAVSSKILDNLLHRTFAFDFHQFISLLSLGFLALHILVLSADRYMPYSLAQIFIPFLSPYRPLWVGVGVIALYLTGLVTVTFYLRQRIGMQVFRYIHFSSLLAYLGATAHGFFSGTDTPLLMALLMYFFTFIVFVFFTVYWLYLVRTKAPT